VELSFDAAEALGRIGAPAVPALITQLGDKDVYIRKHAAWALRRMGPQAKAAVPALVAVSKDGNAVLRGFTVGALGKIGPEARGAAPALIDRLQDTDAKIRKLAAWGLGSIGPGAKEAVAALVQTLKDPEDEVRESAAWALGKIGPDARAATPALIEATKTDAHGLVAEALGRIGPDAKAAAPTMVTLLEQAQAPTKIKAALAHWRITGQEAIAVTVLTVALMDEDSTVRCDAADALGEIGPKAKTAVPALRALLQRVKGGNHIQDRQAALQALKRIDPQAAKKRSDK
jgi:HEAT repeat protein